MLKVGGTVTSVMGAPPLDNIYRFNPQAVVMVDPAVGQSTAFQKTLLSYDPDMPKIKRGVDNKISSKKVFTKTQRGKQSLLSKSVANYLKQSSIIDVGPNAGNGMKSATTIINNFGPYRDRSPSSDASSSSTESNEESSPGTPIDTAMPTDQEAQQTDGMVNSMNEMEVDSTSGLTNIRERLRDLSTLLPDNERLRIVTSNADAIADLRETARNITTTGDFSPLLSSAASFYTARGSMVSSATGSNSGSLMSTSNSSSSPGYAPPIQRPRIRIPNRQGTYGFNPNSTSSGSSSSVSDSVQGSTPRNYDEFT